MCVWNGRGGACVPARMSAQRRFHTKIYLRIMHEDLTMDAPLAGRHGRAHRRRPYQTPSYLSTQSHTNKITIYMQSTQTKCTGTVCAIECRRVIIICIEVPIKSARRGRLGYCLNYSFVHLAGELQWYNYNHYHHYHSYKTQ